MSHRVELAIAYLIAATSAVLASLYGFMSASGYFGIAKGAGLCLVALIGCHGPAWTAKLKREMGWTAAGFGLLVTVACLAVTLLGGIGTVASGTAILQASQSKLATNMSRDRTELDRLTSERAGLQFTPMAAEGVQAAREAVTSAQRNRETECESGRMSRCRERETGEQNAREALTVALGNRAATETAARLDNEIVILRTKLDAAPATVLVDPQASAFSQLTGLPVDTAAALYAFLFSVALELAAMFAMLVAYSRPAEISTAEPVASRTIAGLPLIEPPKPETANRAAVARFMINCLPRELGKEVEARLVYMRFVRWCGEQSPALCPLDPAAFAVEFRALCDRGRIRVRYDGQRSYCGDVRLVG